MTKEKSDTEQLQFWRGDFGNSYIDRNAASSEHLRARVAMWARIMDCLVGDPPRSILEVGSNIGNNLRALRTLTGAAMYALEPNAEARRILVGDGVVPTDQALEGFAAKIPVADGAVDMAFTSGVLIHIHPDDLLASMREIHRVARRYVVCIEYFSDKPEMIPYRGHDDRLFKRDFGGYYLDNFPDLRVVDYGFSWKRLTGLDNLTWWVFEKRA
jgi:pseudaminic acid biosynthesis-associated methylase